MDERNQQMFKAKVRGPLQEVILPDFPDDDNTVTTTITKSRRVSFGTNFVKEFIVGSAVSAQFVSEYEQAFSSSDSSNPNSSHSAVESGILDSNPFVSKENQKIPQTVPQVVRPGPELSENCPKRRKFSTICFNADSPTANMEFTEGCINLAKNILEKKNKDMTVIIQAKPKDTQKEETLEKVNKEQETRYFDGSEFEMSMTNCFKSSDIKKDEKRLPVDKTRIFTDLEDEMSITRCDKVFRMKETEIPSDNESDLSMEDNCKKNQIPLDVIMHHLDKDDSDLKNSLFYPDKSLNDVLNSNPFDFSNDSEKLNLNESMDISRDIHPSLLKDVQPTPVNSQDNELPKNTDDLIGDIFKNDKVRKLNSSSFSQKDHSISGKVLQEKEDSFLEFMVNVKDNKKSQEEMEMTTVGNVDISLDITLQREEDKSKEEEMILRSEEMCTEDLGVMVNKEVELAREIKDTNDVSDVQISKNLIDDTVNLGITFTKTAGSNSICGEVSLDDKTKTLEVAKITQGAVSIHTGEDKESLDVDEAELCGRNVSVEINTATFTGAVSTDASGDKLTGAMNKTYEVDKEVNESEKYTEMKTAHTDEDNRNEVLNKTYEKGKQINELTEIKQINTTHTDAVKQSEALNETQEKYTEISKTGETTETDSPRADFVKPGEVSNVTCESGKEINTTMAEEMDITYPGENNLNGNVNKTYDKCTDMYKEAEIMVMGTALTEKDKQSGELNRTYDKYKGVNNSSKISFMNETLTDEIRRSDAIKEINKTTESLNLSTDKEKEINISRQRDEEQEEEVYSKEDKPHNLKASMENVDLIGVETVSENQLENLASDFIESQEMEVVRGEKHTETHSKDEGLRMVDDSSNNGITSRTPSEIRLSYDKNEISLNQIMKASHEKVLGEDNASQEMEDSYILEERVNRKNSSPKDGAKEVPVCGSKKPCEMFKEDESVEPSGIKETEILNRKELSRSVDNAEDKKEDFIGNGIDYEVQVEQRSIVSDKTKSALINQEEREDMEITLNERDIFRKLPGVETSRILNEDMSLTERQSHVSEVPATSEAAEKNEINSKISEILANSHHAQDEEMEECFGKETEFEKDPELDLEKLCQKDVDIQSDVEEIQEPSTSKVLQLNDLQTVEPKGKTVSDEDMSEREPPLVDARVLDSLKEQSKEKGCLWSVEDQMYSKNVNRWNFNFKLLESSTRVTFLLSVPDEDTFDFEGSLVQGSEICLLEDKRPRLQEYIQAVEFGFQKQKEFFMEKPIKVESVRQVPYLLDLLNSHTVKLNSYLSQIDLILRKYPGSSLKDSRLSFRLYSFPVFFSSTISIDLTDMFRLSKSSVSFNTDLGSLNEDKIVDIFDESLKCENSLIEFILRSTKYVIELERELKCISKRYHIELLPPELRFFKKPVD